jgi:phosphatidylserine decarboxylase
MAVAPEGKGVLLVAALLAVLGVSAAVSLFQEVAVWIVLLSLAPLAFALYFFRDPERRPPDQTDIVVAPADGRVIEIADARPEFLLGERENQGSEASHLKLSIFMSPLNVHVNRIPVSGEVAGLQYQKGKFGGAFKGKASSENERHYIRLDTVYGAVGCVQVAGWLARRIVCHLNKGQKVAIGQRFGIIKFGSRLDLYLPRSCRLTVEVGQKTKAGETVVALFREE